MTNSEHTVTREIAPLPVRRDDAHKGDVGRVAVVGGCFGETMMAGAPALTANAALRAGAGLVQVVVPEPIRAVVSGLAPCATLRSLPTDAAAVVKAIEDFGADVVALGPGLGQTLDGAVVVEILNRLSMPVVLDADGLNRVAEAPRHSLSADCDVVMTPHAGELKRLLAAAGDDRVVERDDDSRRAAALALAEVYGSVVVFKGKGTIVTDGRRLYINETGNAGLATGGAGDVLTGVIAALIGQGMDRLEAAILAVYLHGLAGDFAAEELGRWSVTATDLVDYLHVAFSEHHMSTTEDA